MRISSFFIPTTLLLLQNAQIAHGTNVLSTGDGEESAPGAVVCYLFPCFDESLGWRNIFAPIAADPEEEEATQTLTAEEEEEASSVRQQLWTFLQDFVGGNGEEDGGSNRRNLRANHVA